MARTQLKASLHLCFLTAAISGVLAVVVAGCTSPPNATGPQQANASVSGNSNAASNSSTASSETSGNSDKHIVRMPADAEREAGVAIEEAADRRLDVSVDVNGEVLANANTQVHVTPVVTGRVTEILVKIGDHVDQGKPLLVVRSTDIQQSESDLLQGEQQVRADLKQALVQTDCDIKEAEASVDLDRKMFNRLKSLFEEKIASQADFQTAETTLKKDEITVEALNRKRDATISLSYEKMKLVTGPLKSKLKMLGVTDSQIDKVMHTQVVDPYVPVLASEEGIVVERLVNVGELIDPSKALFTVGEFDSVWLKADVYEKDIPKVHKGQPIELEVDSFPNEIFHGTLDYLASQVDPDTRTLMVRGEVSNPKDFLRPKMFGLMHILVGEHKVLSIKRTAVQDAGTEKVVYVPTGRDGFEERKVTLGVSCGDYVEILTGLKPGDKVVTTGSFDLRAQAVRVYG